MNEQELLNVFIETLEHNRISLDKTQKEMAHLLEMSESAYKKTVSGQRTGTGLLYTAHKLGTITGISAIELLNIPPYTEKGEYIRGIVQCLRCMSPTQLRYIREICEWICDEKIRAGV